MSSDQVLRQRLIDVGLLRPKRNELDHIQLPRGTVVFKVNPTVFDRLHESYRNDVSIAHGMVGVTPLHTTRLAQ